ncbi:MAG: thermonuclease family protein [Bacilli bacterium]|nr:thermonuclease family protein [Bacilli bacterium]
MKKRILPLLILPLLLLSACTKGGDSASTESKEDSSTIISSDESLPEESLPAESEEESLIPSEEESLPLESEEESIPAEESLSEEETGTIPGDQSEEAPVSEEEPVLSSEEESVLPSEEESVLPSEEESAPAEESEEESLVPSEAESEEESVLPSEEEAEFIDYAHDGEVKLKYDYKDHDFYTDGIGEVTLKSCIDGDTAHFYPVVQTTSRQAIKSRFYGIDTPESTGRIQPYGKPASNFTKQHLQNAAENGTIVVSTARDGYGTPIPDSTGERYVSLIWINETEQNASYDSLILLNLYIVQEGFSWVKNVEDIPEYKSVFYAAESQAKAFKLNLFSGEDDPTFPKGDFEVVTILDLKRETIKTLEDPTYHSDYDFKKVCITGTVAGYSNGTMYLEDFYDEESGGNVPGGYECASINVFCGMSSVPSKYTAINTYLCIFATAVHSEEFGFQITGAEGHFPSVTSLREDDDAIILLKAAENIDDHQLRYLEYTPQELTTVTNELTFECLNCAVRVTEPVTVSRFYISTDNKEITLSFKNCSFQAYITFNYAGDPDRPQYYWKTEEDFLNKQFLLQGVYTYYTGTSGKTSYQIVFNSVSDLVWVNE